MMSRTLLTSSLASGALLATPAIAQRKAWVMPEEFKPRVVRLEGGLPEGEIHVDPSVLRCIGRCRRAKPSATPAASAVRGFMKAGRSGSGPRKNGPLGRRRRT